MKASEWWEKMKGPEPHWRDVVAYNDLASNEKVRICDKLEKAIESPDEETRTAAWHILQSVVVAEMHEVAEAERLAA